jgi:hypothetical protein
MTKPIPCGFCQCEPQSTISGNSRTKEGATIYWCETPKCIHNLKRSSRWFYLDEWNEYNTAILAQRRADFDTGVLRGRIIRVGWEDRKTWFDDYLKEQHEKAKKPGE